MTNYERGRRFEWQTRDDLESNGYVVARTAGSKTRLDLIAVKPGELLFVQCKLEAGALGPSEWDTLYRLAGWAGAKAILAEKDGSKVRYWLLTGPKLPGRTMPKQAAVSWCPDEVERAATLAAE